MESPSHWFNCWWDYNTPSEIAVLMPDYSSGMIVIIERIPYTVFVGIVMVIVIVTRSPICLKYGTQA
ncbi:hypothetical protein Barb6_03721 [Bacteroidales bacterium Barb6]|nr:hypothetical protein Barb6_03721 [Bacteroidales bacterium Barb6]OAV64142.1 hypothetical protein Barb4_04387 [Bacteroidales bacterium Barb4]